MVEFDLPAHAEPRGITLLHVSDCPNLALARDRVIEAADRAGVGVRVEERLVGGLSDAAELGFTGSPTILVDGVDPFADTDPAVPSMACRLYRTDEGVQGAPGVDALVRVLQR
jgi:hypothetical protein